MTLRPDDTLENADWMKTLTWNVWCGDVLVQTVPDLLMALEVFAQPPAVQKTEVLKFLKLPCAVPMPNALKAGIRNWMRTL